MAVSALLTPYHLFNIGMAVIGWILVVVGGSQFYLTGSFWFMVVLDIFLIVAYMTLFAVYESIDFYRGAMNSITILTTVNYLSIAGAGGALTAGCAMRLIVNFMWLIVWGSDESTLPAQLPQAGRFGLQKPATNVPSQNDVNAA